MRPGTETGLAAAWRRDRRLRFGLATLVGLGLAGLCAPLLYPVDPNAMPDPVGLAWRAPSAAHWFGTDALGRDVLARLMAGTRVSLSVALLASGVAFVVGTGWGIVAGWRGGVVDTVLMAIVDTCMAIPRVLLLIIILGFWDDRSALVVGVVLGITDWMRTSRLVRADVRAAREAAWVVAARVIGASDLRILRVHLLPIALRHAAIAAALAAAHALMLEAGLAAIGLGVAVPQATWGTMLASAVTGVTFHWWMLAAAGVPLLLASAAFVALSDAAQELLDPRQALQ